MEIANHPSVEVSPFATLNKEMFIGKHKRVENFRPNFAGLYAAP